MKVFSQIISYVFHPVLLVSYGLVVLYAINPYLFSVVDSKAMGILFIYIFLLSVFFPVLSISLMKSLGFIKSLHMRDRTDRIGPLISTAIFYLWLFINIYRNPGIPLPFSIFVLGSVIALFIAFFINNFSKISLHSIGMGGMLVGAIFIKARFSYEYFTIGGIYISLYLFLIFVILIVGLVMTARLILKSHKPSDVYGGFLIGAFSQILAILFMY